MLCVTFINSIATQIKRIALTLSHYTYMPLHKLRIRAKSSSPDYRFMLFLTHTCKKKERLMKEMNRFQKEQQKGHLFAFTRGI